MGSYLASQPLKLHSFLIQLRYRPERLLDFDLVPLECASVRIASLNFRL